MDRVMWLVAGCGVLAAVCFVYVFKTIIGG